uniref:Uncharacterized protein n=2 Tax=Oryza TaxID=4527 RepID=A0A0E0QNE1_ORYRU
MEHIPEHGSPIRFKRRNWKPKITSWGEERAWDGVANNKRLLRLSRTTSGCKEEARGCSAAQLIGDEDCG